LNLKSVEKVLITKPLNSCITEPLKLPCNTTDSLSLTVMPRLVSTKSASDIKEFVKIFVSSVLDIAKKKEKHPDNIKNKIVLGIGRCMNTKIHTLVAKTSNLQVIKDANGKIIGGFSYGFRKDNNLCIGQMVLDSSKRNTAEGRAILLQIAKKIKFIARTFNQKLITCNVDKHQKSLVRLYRKCGFIESPKDNIANIAGLYRLEVTPEEFCKNFLDCRVVCFANSS
jgi:hypothetical protein